MRNPSEKMVVLAQGSPKKAREFISELVGAPGPIARDAAGLQLQCASITVSAECTRCWHPHHNTYTYVGLQAFSHQHLAEFRDKTTIYIAL